MASVLQRTRHFPDRSAPKNSWTDELPSSGSALHRSHAGLYARKQLAASDGRGHHITSEARKNQYLSRGTRLLLRAKEYHLAVRGLQQTSGFRYISGQPKRNAKSVAAKKLRAWDFDTEQLPPEEIHIWKLTTNGAIDITIVPDALFAKDLAPNEKKELSTDCVVPGAVDTEEMILPGAVTPCASETPTRGWAFPQQQQQQRRLSSAQSLNNLKRAGHVRTESSAEASNFDTTLDADGTGDTHVTYGYENTSKPHSEAVVAKSSSNVDGFGRRIFNAGEPEQRRQAGPPEGTLELLAWGWGGEFRLGTGCDRNEAAPKTLPAAFKGRQFVDVAAGRRHTIFLTDDGIMFSVGEGLRWQLGTISAYNNHAAPRAVQRLPTQVHPSGDLKVGRDYQIAQVEAGNTFSVAREANRDDAVRSTEKFLKMKASVKALLNQSPSSKVLSELWEQIEEEERTLQRRFEGRLLSWGTGPKGQLGLGPDVDERLAPRVLRTLSGIPMITVTAGAEHALCLTLDGKVYSWGSGQDGRLGHRDYKDRWQPCRVEGLGTEAVGLIAAGTAHSMAVSLPQSVYVWGRGAHGRLGTGDNRCRHAPVRLKSWPSGFLGCVVQKLALGGAHSIVLAHRSVPTTLANPWGADSLVYAWGYGQCGQLGLGEDVDEVTAPSRVAFDRKELVTCITAGKSYSLASNIQGQLFAWGKGWSGQLGLGKVKDYRVAPTKVNFPGSRRHLIVKLCAGQQHTLALALASTPPPRGWDRDKEWRKVTEGHFGMKKRESSLLERWRCPRRPPWRKPGPNPEPFFACATCDLPCICRKCARSCHQGHVIRRCTKKLRVLCECGIRPCEWGAGDGKPNFNLRARGGIVTRKGDVIPKPTSCRLLVAVEDEDEGPSASARYDNAVQCQRIIRGWFGRQCLRRLKENTKRRRREAMEAVWYVTVLGTMERSIARFVKDEERERSREGMAAADVESAFYRYYSKLQPAIQAINQQRDAIKDISSREGATFEICASSPNSRIARGHSPPINITLWSRRAVRQLQRRLPPAFRVPEGRLVQITANLPAGGRLPVRGLLNGCNVVEAGLLGGVADPDVDALLRSSQPSRKRCTVDVAGPEGLYRRVTRMRAGQIRRLESRRRMSFSEGDNTARVDKSRSDEDIKWACNLGRYWMGVDKSLAATRYLQIGQSKCNRLADPRRIRYRRGARALHKFLRGFGPGSVDPDVSSVKQRGRRGRAHSLCAPERVYAAKVTWERRHAKLQTLLRAAAKRGYPISGDSVKWTVRAEKWGGLTPAPRRGMITIDALRKSGQRIVVRAAKRGWDLRPASQSRPGSSGNRLGGDDGLDVSPGVPETWSPYNDGFGNTYFVNDLTGVSTWELPTATEDQIQADGRTSTLRDAAALYTASGSALTATGEADASTWWDDGVGTAGDNERNADTTYSEYARTRTQPRELGLLDDETNRVVRSWKEPTEDWAGAINVQEVGQSDGGWSQLWDGESGACYWYNVVTGESQW